MALPQNLWVRYTTADRAKACISQAAATLDVLAVRQAKVRQDIPEGKSFLADIVRMLVAWERSMEER